MAGKLLLKDLDVGKTDCKHELLRNDRKQKDKFEASFLIPDNINMDKFLKRDQFEYYFITGLKGVGKTCLLRYIGLKINELENSHSSLILFKSELKDDKSELARATKHITKIKEYDVKFAKTPDYDLLWDWIIHRHIVDTIENKNLEVFKRDIYWKNYSTCVKAIIAENKRRLIPTIKNGSIRVSTKFIEIATKIKLDLNLSSSDATVKFEKLITTINRLYLSLTHNKEDLFILFDELELTPYPRKYFYRDIRLIRDLIDTIERFNAVAVSKNGSVFLIAAVRSEVLGSLAALGREINKSCIDFGVEISWKNSNKNSINHPLLKILEKRIKAAEMYYDERSPTENVWKAYFPEKIHGIDTRKYILLQTWYKPRDIIRLILIAKEICPNESIFSQEVFDAIEKDYSKKSWEELCEELRITHSIDELDAIQQILHRYKREFSYEEIIKHIADLRDVNNSVDLLFKRYSPKDILDELYRIGAIGNVYKYRGNKEYRFIYKGDSKILLNEKIIIHRGILPYLCIEPDL